MIDQYCEGLLMLGGEFTQLRDDMRVIEMLADAARVVAQWNTRTSEKIDAVSGLLSAERTAT
ncbi:MAG TPA: hypothetical protein VM620_10505 [Hyphomicrobium sp.]|nr:hypothetical protein [Hyphomicrobium sp.]